MNENENTQAIDATVKQMDVFAREGLRTLVVAQAELDPVVYEKWADCYEQVLSIPTKRVLDGPINHL